MPTIDPPRLLYFTGRYRPGSMAVPVHAEVLQELAARGFPGAIVTLGPADQREPIVVARDGDLTVYNVGTSTGPLDRLANRLSARRYDYPYLHTAARHLRPWLRQALAARPDTILQVEMAFPMGALARRAAAGLPARAVVTLRGADVLVDPELRYGRALRPAVRRELARVFAWAAVVRPISPLLAARARELGCPPGKIAIVPTNLGRHFYPTVPLPGLRAVARAELGAELGLPPDARLLLSGGRGLPIKGFDTLIAALPLALARQPATHVLLYGPDRLDTTAALAAQASALGLADRVRFLGELPFTGQGRYLAAADLAVIPSTFDGFNKGAAEAAAHGTPLVVSDRAGIADFVRDYGAGRVIPPRDPAALAAAVCDLLDDEPAWRAASAAAVRLADECRVERVADGLAALYRRISAG